MLKSYINRGNRSINCYIPAPTGGLNCRDTYNNMAAEDAIVMDNYIPYNDKIALRHGFVDYYKDGNCFLTLAAYTKDNQHRLIGISSGKAYNLSSPTKVAIYENVSFNDNRCQTVQYKDRLFFMNGVDIPKVYYLDDNNQEIFTDWQFSAEGLNSSKIISGCVSKQFLWCVERGSLRAWYSEVAGNISGNMHCFDLSPVSRFSGYLVAICSWTVDGGTGMDDLTVFITSEGEVMVYSGINPNSAESWTLKGSYKISSPIGYRCCLQYQGDVVIITEEGYLPLSKVLPLNEAGTSTYAFSDKIRNLVLQRSASGKSKDGWQGVIYTGGGYALFNVPLSQGYEQHVINLNTGAWCRFTGIKSHCWVIFADKIYFGSDYGVCQFDKGYSDNGLNIKGEVRQAYNNLGFNGLKKIQLLNPHTASSGRYSLTFYTDVDYKSTDQNSQADYGYGGLTGWGKVKWSANGITGQTKWQTFSCQIRSGWIANSATGNRISIVFKTDTCGNIIEWYDTGVRYEQATGIM